MRLTLVMLSFFQIPFNCIYFADGCRTESWIKCFVWNVSLVFCTCRASWIKGVFVSHFYSCVYERLVTICSWYNSHHPACLHGNALLGQRLGTCTAKQYLWYQDRDRSIRAMFSGLLSKYKHLQSWLALPTNYIFIVYYTYLPWHCGMECRPIMYVGVQITMLSDGRSACVYSASAAQQRPNRTLKRHTLPNHLNMCRINLNTLLNAYTRALFVAGIARCHRL